MACDTEWDNLQSATADRIASDLLVNAALTLNAEKREAEWEACLAWWNCNDNSGGSGSRMAPVSRDEAQTKLNLSKLDRKRLAVERAGLMAALVKAVSGGGN
jgi:hypothetical protein